MLKHTPLYRRHVEAGARMVPFAGFEMPVQYDGVVQEHRAVREAVGLFDVSHMGEVELRGPKAVEVADRIVTNWVARLDDGQACYTCMCRDDGGIVDDLVVYRFSHDHVFICVNAANREKDYEYMKEVADGDCSVEDTGDAWAQLAVQGPKSEQLVSRLASVNVLALPTYRFTLGEAAGVKAIIARTGYTGEDGFELYVDSEAATQVWDALVAEGARLGLQRAGLGARDSLRLEMCYPLYGNDIDETTHPYEAGLGWVVKLNKPSPFAGRAKLEAIKTEGPSRRLVPLEMLGRGIPRPGYSVLDSDGNRIGQITSGTQGPSVERGIGLAYVPTELASQGTRLMVEVRDRSVEARITTRPFWERSTKSP